MTDGTFSKMSKPEMSHIESGSLLSGRSSFDLKDWECTSLASTSLSPVKDRSYSETPKSNTGNLTLKVRHANISLLHSWLIIICVMGYPASLYKQIYYQDTEHICLMHCTAVHCNTWWTLHLGSAWQTLITIVVRAWCRVIQGCFWILHETK